MKYPRFKALPQLLLVACVAYAGTAVAIDVPVDLRGTEVRQNTVKWEWAPVAGAVKYEVTVNGEDKGTTRDTKFYSYDLGTGEHVMFVRAVDGNGDQSAPTVTVKINVSSQFSFGTHGRSSLVTEGSSNAASGSFGVPQNPTGVESGYETIQWQWDAVSGAVAYEVTVDGIRVGTTGDTSWESKDMWKGGHSMTVKAVNSSGDMSSQSITAKTTVTGNAGSADTSSSRLVGSTSSSSAFGKVQGLRANELSGNDVQWQWDAVSGAVEYEVTIDGLLAGNTSSTEWVSDDLWTGTHSLTVKAIDDSGSKTEQSETLRFEVTGNGSGSATTSNPVAENQSSPAPPPAQNEGGDPDAANVQSLIDPASYDYSEVSNKSGYELVFSDEFNGTALNPYRWHSQLRWDGEWNGERYEYRIINGEDQFYVNVLSPDPEHQSDIVPVYNPFKFNGSHMSIKAKLNPLNDTERRVTHGKLDDIVHQQPFLSGAISTHEKFAQKYGYFEARIKIPSHVGTFPAFWLFHERRAWEGTQRTEIDIMENLGHAPEYVYNSFHYFKNVTETYGGDANFIKPKPSGQIYNGTDFSRDFHVYAVEWSPGKITWFIDGQKVSELYESEADYEELYLMINLAMGGNWTNFPSNAGGLGRSSSERFPTANDLREFSDPELQIDYVRVYRGK